jgi:hypothetical protein
LLFFGPDSLNKPQNRSYRPIFDGDEFLTLFFSAKISAAGIVGSIYRVESDPRPESESKNGGAERFTGDAAPDPRLSLPDDAGKNVAARRGDIVRILQHR